MKNTHSLDSWTEMVAREPLFQRWTEADFRVALWNRWGITTGGLADGLVKRWQALLRMKP